MKIIPFGQTLQNYNLSLDRESPQFLQINVGRLCNQVCHHCHVEAGPKRKEVMTEQTAQRILKLLEKSEHIHTVDLTGGAPELNPSFKMLVKQVRSMGKKVIDRCNLTVFYEKGQEGTAPFLAQYQITVVASLPCYSESNVDKQRGKGVFRLSIEALKLLNSLGYGREGTGLQLDLVYNPVGAFLPPPQQKLEADYKTKLKMDFGIEFNHLYTITNMPIKRFLWELDRAGQWEHYMNVLVNAFNPIAAKAIMCRNLVSVGWDGQLYDCDFNQMLEIPLARKRTTIWDISSLNEINGSIAFANHCYGCTAGAGSSCGGALS